jgi:TP901 family phage tail tape measure protein
MAQTDVGIRVVVLGAAQASRMLGNIRDDLSRFSREIYNSQNRMEKFGRSVVTVGDALSSMGRTMTYTITAPLVGAIGALTSQGIKFEEAFAGVSKTVNGVAIGFTDVAKEMYGTSTGLTQAQKDAVFANKSFGDLTKLGKELRDNFRDLALEIPISASELAKTGQIAGQLGVSADQITEFTKVMALLGTATDLNAEQAAFAIARFGNIMGVADKDVAKFANQMGNSLVALGNNAAATESEISNMALRLAAAGRSANITSPDILGISAALAEMGIKAERGGTAVSRLLYEMIFSIADGGDEVKTFAQVAGLSVQDFTALFKRDAVGAMDVFLKKLTEMQEAGTLTSDMMKDMGLSGVRVREVVNILGPNMKLLRDDIALSNKAWTEQIALQEETTKRFKTVQSIIQLTKNTLADLGITIFDLVRDDIVKLLKGIQSVAKFLRNMDEGSLHTILRISALTAAIGPLLLVLGTMTQLLGNNIIGFGKVQGVIGGLVGSLNPFSGLFGAKKGGKSKSLIEKGTGFITGIFKGISGKIIKPVGSLLLGGLSEAFDFATGGIKFAVGGVSSFISSIVKSFKESIDFLAIGFSPLIKVFKAPFVILDTLTKTATGTINLLLGGVFKGIKGIGGLLGSVLGKLPGFGSGLVKFILSPLGKLPQILAVAAAGFALILGPKVITQFIKNKDKVFDELKLSAKQFKEDLSKQGLEKSIMLFFSGGSTGSGREGGLRGLALALGASKDNANRFSYAMGTAAFWVVKIVKDTGKLLKNIVRIVTKSDDLSGKAKTTSDRLVSFAQSVAKFMEGISVGWLNSFTGIIDAVKVFAGQAKIAANSFKGLFDTIFGRADKAKTGIRDFYASLEPGAVTTASKVGVTIGSIIGNIVTLTVQGLTFITTIVGSVAKALTQLVAAYKESGIKGVFGELGPALETVFDGFFLAADMLWDNLKPKFNTFVTNTKDWLKKDGADTIAQGIEGLFGAFGHIADRVLFGSEDSWNKSTEKFVRALGIDMAGNLNGLDLGLMTEKEFQSRDLDFQKNFFPAPVTVTSFTKEQGSEGLAPKFARLIDNIYSTLTSENTRTKINEALDTVVGWMGDQLQAGWEILRPKLEDLFGQMSEWAQTTGVPTLKKVGNDIAKTIWDGMKEGLEEKLFGWKPDAIQVQSQPATFVGEPAPFIEQYFPNSVTKEAVKAGNKTIQDIAKSIQDKFTLQKSVEQAQIRMREFGETSGTNTVEGYVNGVGQNTLLAQNSVTTMANKIKTTFKSAFGIYSPSSVFAEYGRNIIQGLAQGLSGISPLYTAINAITNLIRNMQMSFSASVNSIIQQATAAQARLTAAQAASNVVANVAKTVFGSTTNTSTTNTKNSVYNPVFYGPPAQQTVTTNKNLFSQWMAVG